MKAMTTKQRPTASIGLGFPKILKMTHRYCQTVRIVSSSGVPAFQRFRANGIFDPDQSGAGNNVSNWSIVKNVYNHWRVIGSKISVQFIPTASTTVPQHVGILADDDTVNSFDIDILRIQPDGVRTAIAFNNSTPRRLTNRYSAKKTYGGSIMGNTSLLGTSSADPTEQFYFTLFNSPVDGGTSVGVDAIVTIDYIVVWSEQKDVDE